MSFTVKVKAFLVTTTKHCVVGIYSTPITSVMPLQNYRSDRLGLASDTAIKVALSVKHRTFLAAQFWGDKTSERHLMSPLSTAAFEVFSTVHDTPCTIRENSVACP